MVSFDSVGDVAQLGEHQVRNLGVEGSIPFVSTNLVNNSTEIKKGVVHKKRFLFLRNFLN